MTDPFSHFDSDGASRMVDVGEKTATHRRAVASAIVRMQPATLVAIRDRKASKGDVLEVARLAGIMATKQTGQLIPLCHPIAVDAVNVDFEIPDDCSVRIKATVSVTAKTGVEMEALTSVSVAALTIYDMCKSLDRDMEIVAVRLEEKSGGRSGLYIRNDNPSKEN
jgi:cyclic pyranopterin phosphate synthase